MKKPRKSPDTAPGESASTCTCPSCGHRFPVAIRAIGPKPPRPPDPRQLTMFPKRRREPISISELLGDE